MAAGSIEYSETVLGHFRAPQNAGAFPAGTPRVIEGRAGARRQGREITLARTKRNHGLSWFQRHEPVGEEAHGDRRRAGQ